MANSGRPSRRLSQRQTLCRAILAARRARKPPSSCGQFGLKAEGPLQASVDRLHDLPLAGQPAPLRARPAVMAAPLGWSDRLRMVVAHPLRLTVLPGKAAVSNVDAAGRLPATWQVRRDGRTLGEEGLGQGAVIGAGRSHAPPGDDALWGATHQQPHPLDPAPTQAAADIGNPGQPAPPAPLGVAGRRGAVQHLIAWPRQHRAGCRHNAKAVIGAAWRRWRLNCGRLGRRGKYPGSRVVA